MRDTLIVQNLDVIEQGRALLGRLAPDIYAPNGLGWPGIGPHIRHCLDFYEALLGGWSAGRVDYDRRARDPELEADPRAAVAAFDSVAARLTALPSDALDRGLRVAADATDEQAPRRWTRSSLGRELRFLLSHTIHHYALVALLLRQRDIEPGSDFGVAPSTLAHRAKTACAR